MPESIQPALIRSQSIPLAPGTGPTPRMPFSLCNTISRCAIRYRDRRECNRQSGSADRCRGLHKPRRQGLGRPAKRSGDVSQASPRTMRLWRRSPAGSRNGCLSSLWRCSPRTVFSPSAPMARNHTLAYFPLEGGNLCPTAGSRRQFCLPDVAHKLLLADHRLNQRHQHIKGAPSREGSVRRITGDDRDLYFRRKSQIFGEDPASGTA